MQTKMLIASALVGVVLMLSGTAVAFVGSSTELSTVEGKNTQSEPIINSSQIIIDVSGAVFKPGIYSLASGSRMDQAIKIAGGVTPTADSTYIAKSLNLSQKLTDGMKIYIPTRNEAVSSSVGSSQVAGDSLVDINSASVDQLDKLPGIGPTTSANIIAKRPYQTVNDLLAKKVVSKSVFTKIEKLVVAR